MLFSLPVVEVLRIAERVIPKSLCGRKSSVGSHELPGLRAQLVEDVLPAALAAAPKQGCLLLVHLNVLRERRLPGKDPPPPPIPPPPQRAAGELADGRHGLRLPEDPVGGGCGQGLDLDRVGGDPLP